MAALAIPAAALRGRLAGREPLVTREALRALKANRDVRHDKAARELGHDPRPLLETVEALHDWFVGRRLVPARGRRAG